MSHSTAANRAKIRKMQKVKREQARLKVQLKLQTDQREPEMTKIYLTERKKVTCHVVFRALVRQRRQSEQLTSSPTGRTGSGASTVFEAEQ